MRRDDLPVRGQPAPPPIPRHLRRGARATVLLAGTRAFRYGTVRRVHSVPAGIFVDVDFGAGSVGTYRPHHLHIEEDTTP